MELKEWILDLHLSSGQNIMLNATNFLKPKNILLCIVQKNITVLYFEAALIMLCYTVNIVLSSAVGTLQFNYHHFNNFQQPNHWVFTY